MPPEVVITTDRSKAVILALYVLYWAYCWEEGASCCVFRWFVLSVLVSVLLCDYHTSWTALLFYAVT